MYNLYIVLNNKDIKDKFYHSLKTKNEICLDKYALLRQMFIYVA